MKIKLEYNCKVLLERGNNMDSFTLICYDIALFAFIIILMKSDSGSNRNKLWFFLPLFAMNSDILNDECNEKKEEKVEKKSKKENITKKNWFGMILTFLFLVLISIGAMGVKEKSFFLILTCGIFLVLFEWAIYFTHIYGSKIIAYLNQLESRSWLVLLILPLGLIMIESQNCREIAENSLFKIIYNVEILFLELFCQIFVIKITIEAAVKKRDEKR